MKIFQNVQELHSHDLPIWEHFMTMRGVIFDDPAEDLMGNAGGYIHICESQEEVDCLLLSTGFDMFYTAPAGFRVAVDLNNNAGGPSYVIPAEFSVALLRDIYNEFGDLASLFPCLTPPPLRRI